VLFFAAAALAWITGSLVSSVRAEQPILRLGTAAAVAGETTLSVPLEIELDLTSEFVAGWSAVIQYDPAALTAVRVENTRRADLFGFRTFARHAMPGVLVVWAIYTLADDTAKMIPPLSSDEIAQLEFCVLGSAATGTYPLTFLDEAPGEHPYQTSATSFSGIYTTAPPRVEAGAVSISGIDSTTAACPSELDEPPPPPPDVHGSFQLEDATAIRGLPVMVPLRIEADGKIFGFSFSVDFDEEILQAAAVRPVYDAVFADPLGLRSEYQHWEWDNSNLNPGSGGVDEGFVTGAVVFDLESRDFFLPPQSAKEVLRLSFFVNAEAPLGPTEVRFEDGGRFLTIPQRNAFLAAGDDTSGTTYPDFVPATVVVNARISIIGDVSPFRFIRGDANTDGKVDIADAVRDFMFLFQGADPPSCLEAADATDDGEVDISDGVRILRFFFGPVGEIPSPGTESCGVDGLPDDLGCNSYPHCE